MASEIDPENPVVRLCAAGMEAEGEGRPDRAAALFREAWDAAQGDYEAAIAAHYLARHQATPEACLRWNAEAARRAEACPLAQVAGLLPSLYLCLGAAHEALGHRADARSAYLSAAAHVAALGDDGYGAYVRRGIDAALARSAPPRPEGDQ